MSAMTTIGGYLLGKAEYREMYCDRTTHSDRKLRDILLMFRAIASVGGWNELWAYQYCRIGIIRAELKRRGISA